MWIKMKHSTNIVLKESQLGIRTPYDSPHGNQNQQPPFPRKHKSHNLCLISAHVLACSLFSGTVTPTRMSWCNISFRYYFAPLIYLFIAGLCFAWPWLTSANCLICARYIAYGILSLLGELDGSRRLLFEVRCVLGSGLLDFELWILGLGLDGGCFDGLRCWWWKSLGVSYRLNLPLLYKPTIYLSIDKNWRPDWLLSTQHNW